MSSSSKAPTAGADAAANKLLGLELVRFICAFAVLVFHYQHFWFKGQSAHNWVIEEMPGYDWLLMRVMYRFGYLGVEVFWGISGFIFFWKYRQAIASGAVAGYKFFVLRMSRLYPLHLATLLLVVVLQDRFFAVHQNHFVYGNHDLLHFGSHLLMASNWLPQLGLSFNGPVWSVSLEMLVYLLFYWLLRLAGPGAVPVVLVFLACIGARLMGDDSSLVRCIAFFYAGGLVALAAEQADRVGWRGRSAVVACAVVMAIALVAWRMGIHKAAWFRWHDFLLLFVPLLLYVSSIDVQLGRTAAALIEALGNMTYSTYLLHFPVQLAMMLAYSAQGSTLPKHSFWFLCLYLGIVLVLGRLVYVYFELPAQNFVRGKLVKRAAPVPA